MIPTLIKFVFIFYFTIYISLKTLGITYTRARKIIFVFLSIICATIATCFDVVLLEAKHIAPLLIIWFAICILTSAPQRTFVSTVFSFCMSYSIYAISSLLVDFIIYTISGHLLSYHILAMLSGCLQTLLVYKLLNFKRFKKGILLLFRTKALNVSTIFCVAFIAFSIYINIKSTYYIGLLLFALLLAFLIYWWQAQITKAYRHSLELREQESKRIADLEKDILLQKMLKENERLAAITHRDNTLITTLTNATLKYLYTDYSDSEEANKVRDELAENIKALSAGRTILPDNYNEKQARDFDTSFSLLNKLLHQADADAIQSNITFSVHFGVILDEFVPKDISEIDLVYMVDDLLKNAFKATRNSEPRMVQLQFYRLGKHFVVEVADNGIPFETRSLVNMGIEKLTTYEDGSGIGLMNIWDTKEKCGATYHLEEYVTPSPFSKKISLTFDKKNRYSIRTWRKDEILQMSRRADLQVYEHIE